MTKATCRSRSREVEAENETSYRTVLIDLKPIQVNDSNFSTSLRHYVCRTRHPAISCSVVEKQGVDNWRVRVNMSFAMLM